MSWRDNFKDWINSQTIYSSPDDYEFYIDYDLRKMSTMRLSSCGWFLKVRNLDFLQDIFKKFNGKNFIVIGKGANSILSEKNLRQIYLKLDLKNPEDIFKSFQEHYWLSASTSLSKLVVLARDYGLKKWEGLTGIPGTLGGAIVMNAGTKLGEISRIVSEVKIIKSNGEFSKHTVSPINFSYRKNHFLELGDIIVSAKLITYGVNPEIKAQIKDYLKYRNDTQPLWEKTCGSVYKNHEMFSAGKSIDTACLKGLGVSGLTVSEKHANFIVNSGEGKQSDFVRLTNALKSEIELIYGVSFELEARFL